MKRFENRLNKSDIKFNTQRPVWDYEQGYALNVFEMIDELNNLSEENEELKQTIDCICKDYENHHGMDIRNAEWFTAW